MSKSKQKGTLAETAVAQYLKQFWSNVERRALAGINDKGDISGVHDFVIEIKNQKSYNKTYIKCIKYLKCLRLEIVMFF
jgi:hypothetical protein